ncbi:MAG: PorP/SprF family type IX secretion system membrane protein [Chitinophagaceae bacterium]|nr:PorP/SprF family type IX secretion system membrane protein [Chitinophagaceae bacterium]
MKNILLKCLSLIFLCLSFINDGRAQDIHFSQFFETPLLRNPALAGIFNGDIRIQGVMRTQWNSVTVPYQTGSFNAEYKLGIGKADDYLTLAGEILYDKAGTVALTATHILPAINYHKSLSAERNMYLSLGFMGGVVQRKLDRSKITTNNQYNGTGYDPTLSNGETFPNAGYSYMDGSAGLSFNSQVGQNADNNLFLGVAYHHFNKSAKVSFYGDPNLELTPKWVFSGGVRMGVSESSYITFDADYSKQGPNTEIIGGALYSYKLDDPADPHYIFHAGAFLRWKDAMIPVIKMEYRPMTISFSYDANVSTLKSASQGRGGLELSISYQKYLDRGNSSKDAVRCPRF